MEKKRTLSIAAIIFTVLIWGLSFLSIKVSVAVIPPMTLALLRFLIAVVLLFVIMKKVEPQTRLDKMDIPLMAVAGVLGVTLYFYFENNGVKLISASAASMIVSAVPIIALIADAFVFKTRMNFGKGLSVILSVIGVYFIVGGSLAGSWKGYLMMTGSAAAWVAYSMITKPLFKKYSQLSIVYYQSLFGTAALIPFSLLERTDWSLVTPLIMMNVLYLGIFCSAIAYYFYVYSLDALGISEASLFINLIPMVTVIGSYFILKESITVSQIIGGTIVIGSVYLADWSGKSKPSETEAA